MDKCPTCGAPRTLSVTTQYTNDSDTEVRFIRGNGEEIVIKPGETVELERVTAPIGAQRTEGGVRAGDVVYQRDKGEQ